MAELGLKMIDIDAVDAFINQEHFRTQNSNEYSKEATCQENENSCSFSHHIIESHLFRSLISQV